MRKQRKNHLYSRGEPSADSYDFLQIDNNIGLLVKKLWNIHHNMHKKQFEFGAINEAGDNGFMTSLNYHCTGRQWLHFGVWQHLQKTVIHRLICQIWWFFRNGLEMYCRYTEKSVRAVGVLWKKRQPSEKWALYGLI